MKYAQVTSIAGCKVLTLKVSCIRIFHLYTMGMREENLAGESFSGKLATGDPLRDAARAKLMEDQVLAMLERQEKKNMMPAMGEERSGIMMYCKACNNAHTVDIDPEKDSLKGMQSPDCGAAELVFASEKTIREHYTIKNA